MSAEPQVEEEDRRNRGVLAHLVGNVLLGLSVGLLSYYGVTDLLADRAQLALEDDMVALGAIAAPVPRVVEPTGSTGWEGWEDEDEAYWRSLEAGGIFGRLVIPDMELDVVVVEGTGREDLKKGPGRIRVTDVPGPTGNTGISGHRTTYGAPFRRIDELQAGDAIEFYSPFRRYTYEVTEQLIVTPDQTQVVASTEEPMITLTACHPPYSARFRIVVHARLVEVLPLAGEVPGVGG